jgi:hypothetical protein
MRGTIHECGGELLETMSSMMATPERTRSTTIVEQMALQHRVMHRIRKVQPERTPEEVQIKLGIVKYERAMLANGVVEVLCRSAKRITVKERGGIAGSKTDTAYYVV